MTLHPDDVNRLTPYQVLRVTYDVVGRRCRDARKTLEGKGSLIEQIEAAEALRNLEEMEHHLTWFLLQPRTWNQVGSVMREAMIRVRDPGGWASLVQEYLREIVIEVPAHAVIN